MTEPIAPAAPSQGMPIPMQWSIVTALGSATAGAIAGTTLMMREGDDATALLIGMLLGGAIVGWIEWRLLRRYRIPMGGGRWIGLMTAMMLPLHFGIDQVVRIDQVVTVPLLPLVWGLILDSSRGWLLRSHGSKARRWFLLCGIGWVLNVGLFLFFGLLSLGYVRPLVAFFALNGFVNGLWLGLWRGWALTLMLRDRRPS